jgi:hypothetical protein
MLERIPRCKRTTIQEFDIASVATSDADVHLSEIVNCLAY